jgi:polysaccharide pyruvyl transferase WcaK-like protein
MSTSQILRQTLIKRVKPLVMRHSVTRRAYCDLSFHWRAKSIARSWPAATPRLSPKTTAETIIVGYYGDDTVGDRFILLGLLRALHASLPDQPVVVLSMAPNSTRADLAELHQLLLDAGALALADFLARKVCVKPESYAYSIARGDLLMLGGGPMRDNPILWKWAEWFRWARAAGAATMIGGCGFGPFRRAETAAQAKTLLELADSTVLRNHPPSVLAGAAHAEPRVVPDPAFLCEPILERFIKLKRPQMAVNVRSVPHASSRHREIPPEEAAERMGNLVFPVATSLGAQALVPFSMNEKEMIPDSDVSRRTATLVSDRTGVAAISALPTDIPGIVAALGECEFAISTRFHGFILALMLGCRAVAVDGDVDGGKIRNFYEQWLDREEWPSLYRSAPVQENDFVSLAQSPRLRNSVDNLLDAYVTAIRSAVAER